MSSEITSPHLCVVFFPPYDAKLGRRPPGILMARLCTASVDLVVRACLQTTPHPELTSPLGVGQFFVGLETSYEPERPASEYRELATWTGSEKCGHYREFIRSQVVSFFLTKLPA